MLTFENRSLVSADENSPDRILARREPRHADDPLDSDPTLAAEDSEETLDLAGIAGIPRDAVRQILLFLIPRKAIKGKWQQASIRLAILGRILNIDDLGREPLQKLAEQLNVTRSLLSLRQLQLAGGYGLGKLRSSKSKAARLSYAASATAAHIKAGHKMKDNHTPSRNSRND